MATYTKSQEVRTIWGSRTFTMTREGNRYVGYINGVKQFANPTSGKRGWTIAAADDYWQWWIKVNSK